MTNHPEALRASEAWERLAGAQTPVVSDPSGLRAGRRAGSPSHTCPPSPSSFPALRGLSCLAWEDRLLPPGRKCSEGRKEG